MKQYIVRLVNYNGFVVDGEIYEANDSIEALEKYMSRCNRLGIAKCVYDKYTIEEI